MKAHRFTPPSPRATPSTKTRQATVQDNAAAALAQLGLQAQQFSPALLQRLHILTADGRINQDSRRKLKQVQHLLQFIGPILSPLLEQAIENKEKNHTPIRIADHGAGKSYLGFLIYEQFLRPAECGELWAIERRPELIAASRELAQSLGFSRMHFAHMDVHQADAALPPAFDLVCALHACDAATDAAIDFGLRRAASALALVPCCQAEVAALWRNQRAERSAVSHTALQPPLSAAPRTALAQLWRHPLHAREMGSHLTNVLRCLYMQSLGYNVTVTELVGWEHSLKNELILARRPPHQPHPERSNAARRARTDLLALVAEFGLQDWAAQRLPLLPRADNAA